MQEVELVAAIKRLLVAELDVEVYDERWFVRGAPEQGRSRGFLLSRIETS